MKLVIYDKPGTYPTVLIRLNNWEDVAIAIFNNTNYEDSVFAVLSEGIQNEQPEDTILYRGFFDSWKEEQFLNFNGVRVEL